MGFKSSVIRVGILSFTLLVPGGIKAKVHPQAGTVGFAFLKIGVGARPVSMGGAFVAVPGDVNSSYWNPAGLAWIKTPQGTASYLNYLLDIQAGFLGYARPLQGWGTIGVNLDYMDHGQFTETDLSGQELGTFGASGLALGISYSLLLTPRLALGINLKAIYERIEDYASQAVAFDLGWQHQAPIKGLTLGAAVQNLGMVRKGFTTTHEDKLPLNLKVGLAKKLVHLPLLMTLDLNKPVDGYFRFCIGGELSLTETLLLRFGYNSLGSDLKVGSPKDEYAGLSTGLGFRWHHYGVDLAYSSFGELGEVLRVSISGSP